MSALASLLFRLPSPVSRLPILLAIAIVGNAHAQQYRSEVREIAPPPEQTRAKDPATLLKSTTDPYARALLLRDLAGTAAQNKNYKEAARLLDEAIKLNALSGPAVEAMKKDLTALTLATGNYKAQLPQLEAQVKSGSATTETYIALGAAYLEVKRYKDAAAMLRKGVNATPKPDPSWKRALIHAYIGAGQDADAAKLLEQLLRANPKDKDAWIQLSALYLKAGNRERAQATMEIASRLGYLNSAEDRLRLVTLTGQIGAPFEAASVLQGWMKGKQVPTNIENQKLLSALWIRARESALALAVLNDLVVAQPRREWYEQMAQLHLERQDYERASKALSQALALAGESGSPRSGGSLRGVARDGPLLMSLGLARYQLADVDGASRAFAEAVQFAPQKKLAGDWLRYLESGQAREQAMTAAAEAARRRETEAVSLSDRLLGGNVELGEAQSPVTSGNEVAPARGTGELTPVGAERGGNAAGTIPSWTGGLTASQWPAAFRRGGRLVDPYPSERPLFTITAANVAEHRAYLSKGHQELLTKYPSYAMPVYTTRRAAAYPQAIYDATQANVGRAKLTGSDALENAKLGFPFPAPSSGVEAMWNHRVRYRGNTVDAQSRQVVIGADGKEALRVKVNERAYFRYGNTADPVDIAKQNILLYYFLRFTGTGANNIIALAHETANSEKDARAVWVGPPGMGRLFRVPPVGYDNPFPATEGIYFIDMIDMYNGAFDRYVWKLVGKREIYLPYNGYRLSNGSTTYAQMLTPKHLNPRNTRYELHRVWVIEAGERGGKKHAFGQRVFYLDEDTWNVVLVENYDRVGKLWRFQEGHLLPLYDIQAANTLPVVTYDLRDGRYLVNRLVAEEPPPVYDLPMKTSEFLPATVEARHVR